MSGGSFRIFGPNPTSQPLLSVVVPIGPMVNRLSTLIAWVVDIQAYSVQLILVVDEKLDGTLQQLLGEIENLNLRQQLIVINEVCNGPGRARNLGMSKATGKWLAFWDSDDNPQINEIFFAISKAEASVDAVICQYEELEPSGQITARELSNYQIALNPGIWRFIFRRERFPQISFPDLRLAEDQVFLIHSDVFSKTIKHHFAIGYQYVNHGNNQLSKNRTNLPDLVSSLAMLAEYSRTGKIKDEVTKQFFSIIYSRLALTSLRYNTFYTIFFLAKNPGEFFLLLNSLPHILPWRAKK